MITHGNKQISEICYARKASDGGGAVRLTNIIRGAQVVFGGLRPSPSSWGLLDAPTVAAILAAFGQTDGKAVIKATNAYLNALAATDKTKATALAGFINEDPMLVCSLGLQPQGVTMPIRWLVGDGNVWLKLPVNITNSNCNLLRIKSRCKTITSSGWRVNGRGGGYCRYFGIGQNNTFACGNNSDIQTNVSAAPYIGKTIDYDLDFKNGKFIVKHQDNMLVNLSFTASSVASSFASLYCWNSGSSSGNTFKAGFASAEYQFSDVVERNYIPFYNNGNPCLLDLETLQMDAIKIGNGILSIELTQQDGVTPWTPLNQTT